MAVMYAGLTATGAVAVVGVTVADLSANDWALTQPTATIIAGALALSAAAVAYSGVRHTQQTAIKTANLQTRLHARQMRSTAEIEKDKHRRQIVFDELSCTMDELAEAHEAFQALATELSRPQIGDVDGQTLERHRRAMSRLLVRRNRLLLIDLPELHGRLLEIGLCQSALSTGNIDAAADWHEEWTQTIVALGTAYRQT